MKTKLIIFIVIAIVAILGVTGLVLANNSNDSQNTASATPSTTPSSTSSGVNLDSVFPAGLVELKAASFEPAISESQAISIVRDIVREWFYPRPEELPTTATLATFTGECPDAFHTKVQDLPVWVVVIQGIPGEHSGKAIHGDDQEKPYKPSTCQANAAIDAFTGEIIYSCMSGKKNR